MIILLTGDLIYTSFPVFVMPYTFAFGAWRQLFQVFIVSILQYRHRFCVNVRYLRGDYKC